jgi:hypothetical protein
MVLFHPASSVVSVRVIILRWSSIRASRSSAWNSKSFYRCSTKLPAIALEHPRRAAIWRSRTAAATPSQPPMALRLAFSNLTYDVSTRDGATKRVLKTVSGGAFSRGRAARGRAMVARTWATLVRTTVGAPTQLGKQATATRARGHAQTVSCDHAPPADTPPARRAHRPRSRRGWQAVCPDGPEWQRKNVDGAQEARGSALWALRRFPFAKRGLTCGFRPSRPSCPPPSRTRPPPPDTPDTPIGPRLPARHPGRHTRRRQGRRQRRALGGRPAAAAGAAAAPDALRAAARRPGPLRHGGRARRARAAPRLGRDGWRTWRGGCGSGRAARAHRRLPFAVQVREALVTSCMLRLPLAMSRRDKLARVDELIGELVCCGRGGADHFWCWDGGAEGRRRWG